MLDASAGRDARHLQVAGLGNVAAGIGEFGRSDPHRTVFLRGDERVLLAADLRLDEPDELARSLGISGPERRSLNDGDLLFQALLRWGQGAAERVVGDFAFAFFDKAEQRLLLGRDPLGQRPLFWHKGADFVAFASMPRGLHALPDIERRPNLASLARYASGLPEQGSASFFADVQRVEPGHLLVATPSTISVRRYWDPSQEELRFGSFEEAVEAYRATLDQAVRARMRDAGPLLASHLSGGWDSSAVTATAARLGSEGGSRLLAFTASPPDAPAAVAGGGFPDEMPLAAATASLHPGLDHHRVPSSGYSPTESIERAAAWMERPPNNPCNHGWLARIRSQARAAGAHVLLTGEIGNWSISAAPNTLLASFVRQGRWREWGRESRAMLRQRRARLRGVAATSFGPWLPPWALRPLARFAAAPGLEHVLTPEARAPLEDEIAERDFGPSAWPNDHRARTVAAYRRMDFGAYRKGILAGWGVDKRDASADRRLIEFCLRLPLDMLLRDGTRRPLARAALADRLPAAVLDERRKGVQAPDWYQDFDADRPRIAALLDRIEQHDGASALVDVALLRNWLREWPVGDWNRPEVVVRYRIGLLTGLAAGHFAIHASGRNGFVPDSA